MVDAVNPAAVCVSQTIDWYKEGGKNSYDEALNPILQRHLRDIHLSICVINIARRSRIPRIRVNGFLLLLSCFLYGYINESNAATVNPETDPVRYLVPIPPDALSSHQGLLKNYYGY